MIQVRRGTTEDIDALVEMGGRFFTYSAFSGFIKFEKEAARASLNVLVDTGIILVAVHDDQIVGGIAGVIAPIWFNQGARTATELAWWVDDEFRCTSAGIKLYRAFEQWAKAQDVDAIVMSDLIVSNSAPAEKLFQKLGFTTVERSHVKRIL